MARMDQVVVPGYPHYATQRGNQLHEFSILSPNFNLEANNGLKRFILRGKAKVNAQWFVLHGAQYRENRHPGGEIGSNGAGSPKTGGRVR